MLTYILIILAGFLGLFGHWLTRWHQGRTDSTFKRYMVDNIANTLQSVFANLSSSIGICAALPDDLHGKLLVLAIFSAYTAGYAFDSTLNKDSNLVLPQPVGNKSIKETANEDKNKSVNTILDDDHNL